MRQSAVTPAACKAFIFAVRSAEKSANNSDVVFRMVVSQTCLEWKELVLLWSWWFF